MKYFKVEFHRDEIKRFKKRGFKPFVVKWVKASFNAPFELDKGHLISNWPPHVELQSCQDGQLLTRLSNDSDMYLFSNTAIELFNTKEIRGFQYLPVTIYRQDGSVLQEYRTTANIPNQVPCLDLERSTYQFYNPERRPDLVGQISLIEKFVLRSTELKNLEWDVFRLGE